MCSETPPYGHLGYTVTSLLRPLFLAAWQNRHTFPCKKNRCWYDHPLIRPIFLAHIWPYWWGSTVLLLFSFFTSTYSIKSGLDLICHLIIDIETLCKTFSLIFILKCVTKFNLKNQIQGTKIRRVPIVQKIMVYFFTSNFLNFCTLLVMLLVACSRY